MPIANATPRWTETQTFPCDIDHAVIGLMDPAHGPYVHAHWWWKKTPRVKEKHYAPLPFGFVMTAHKPSKPVYSLLGDVTTEITFELPSTRFEIIKGRLFGKPFTVIGLTVCTPRDAERTDIIQVFYWPGWLSFIRPFFMALGPTFIADDRKIVELQREGLKFVAESDADPGFGPARDLVPPGQESLGGIGRKRHGIRQSCAGTDPALEKLIGPVDSGVAAPPLPRLNGPLNLQLGRPQKRSRAGRSTRAHPDRNVRHIEKSTCPNAPISIPS